MAFRFCLGNHGRAFATRERGHEIRRELEAAAQGHAKVIVDFAGVTNVSYSFADEFVGKLHAESSFDVQMENMTEGVGRITGRAVERRAGAVC